jgi:hypothetical protein
MPEDWSFIKIGTKGVLDDSAFEIVGRIRLQLRNAYKNFWCAEYGSGKVLWIVESFNSFSAFTSGWLSYTGDVRKLRAGKKIPVSTSVTGEYVEKCEAVSVEGELGKWHHFHPKFFFVQGSTKDNTAILFLRPNEDCAYMTGKKVQAKSLQLQNLIVWNEWK